jgi:SAM-dependent methyltransferase
VRHETNVSLYDSAEGILEKVMIKEQMERIYRDIPLDKIPWNMATPPEMLVTAVTANMTKTCKGIEMGCGAGNYVIYFSKLGYDFTGADISENAIRMARDSALTAGADCKFIVADVTGDLSKWNSTFDLVYDWELLHHIFPEEREKYINNVHRLLNTDGRYLSVCFSEDSPQFGGSGKYRKTPLDTVLYFSSENEMELLFEKSFVICDLKTVDVKGKNVTHKAIYAFMKKK